MSTKVTNPTGYGSRFTLPVFIPALVLGSVNGLFLGAMQSLALGGPSNSFSLLHLVGHSVAGMLSILGVSIASYVFPNYRRDYLSIIPKSDNVDPNASWYKNRAGIVLLGGTINGLLFWGLTSLDFMRNAGWLGYAFAGLVSLTFYSSILLPLFTPATPANG